MADIFGSAGVGEGGGCGVGVKSEAVPGTVGGHFCEEVVDALVVWDTVGDGDGSDGGKGVLEPLEREGGRVGGKVVEGADGRRKLVVWNFGMKRDALPCKVGCFTHGEDEVGDSPGSWSVES